MIVLNSKNIKIGMEIKHLFNFSNLMFKILKFDKNFITFVNVKSGEIHKQSHDAFEKTKFIKYAN